MDLSQYEVYVGTVRGALAYTQCKPDGNVKFDLTDVEKSEITSMEWGQTENEIIVGHKNGIVKLYSTLNNKYTKTLENLEGKGAVIGVGATETSILVAYCSGHINIWSKMEVNNFHINSHEESTLDCMVQNLNSKNVIATGGERNNLKLWDIETLKPLFEAKSMGHDELNLPIPTSVRGINFFLNENNLVGCATKEGHVLLYDDKIQRRPVIKFLEPKASYTTIACAYRERQCLVGTTKGYIQLIDLRKPTKCIKTFKSFTGSITSLVSEALSPIVISTSLDRYLRIHNLDTKELLYKKYMKQSLTKAVMKSLIKEESEEKINSKEKQIDEEYETLFENMDTVGEKQTKRKRHDEKTRPKKNKKLI